MKKGFAFACLMNCCNSRFKFLFFFLLLTNLCLFAFCRFKDEPQVTKYVKIASTLPDKSVRDVAMRCKWMTVSS